MQPQRHEWLLILIPLFPVGFVVFWCLVSWLISFIGGWRILARDYRALDPRSREGGRFFYLRGGMVGLAQYRGCLTVGLAPAGLHLAVLFPFRVGHPPLLIPWGAVRRVETTREFWRTEGLRLWIAAPGEGRRDRSVQLYGEDLIAGVRAHLPAPQPPPLPGA